MKTKRSVLGVTLIEMLLVMVIISSVIYMGIGYLQQRALQQRFDRTAAQMQQILNAAVTYYAANNSTWPSSVTCLQGGAGCPVFYLPQTPASIISPFWSGNPYLLGPWSGTMHVWTRVDASTQQRSYSYATTIAGMLPLAYTSDVSGVPGSCTPTGATCYVVGVVAAPGLNLQTATAVNFAGIYHSGSCVPVPTCPPDASGNPMTASIIVAPASVAGAADAPTGPFGVPCMPGALVSCQSNAYPINRFAASATAPAATPNRCDGAGTQACASATDAVSGAPTGFLPTAGGEQYWRVCLNVSTEKSGVVTPTSTAWGKTIGTVMAFTRCIRNGEPSGSDFTVWTP